LNLMYESGQGIDDMQDRDDQFNMSDATAERDKQRDWEKQSAPAAAVNLSKGTAAKKREGGKGNF